MPHYYLDSSAVVKCYVPEAGSQATALSLARDLRANSLFLSLVTGDNQIIRAAQAEALRTANPFDYVHLDQPEMPQ